MSLRIFNNLVSNNARRQLGDNSSMVGDSVKRVASGQRINRASDDLASFLVSENLRSDTRVLQQASRNANDGIALLNTAEGSLNQIASIIVRLRELASLSSTGTVASEQRRSLQLESTSLLEEINRIATTAQFAGQRLLDGSLASNGGSQFSLAVGLDSNENNIIDINQRVNISAVDTTTLGINNIDLTSIDNSLSSMATIESALQNVSEIRGRLNAIQNVIIKTAENINTNVTNFTQAQSTLRDADIGHEFARLTRNQLLLESSAAMVGQANLLPRFVLQLLQ